MIKKKQNALEGTMQLFLLSASHIQLYDEEFHCYVSFGGACSDLSMLEQSERSLGREKMEWAPFKSLIMSYISFC